MIGNFKIKNKIINYEKFNYFGDFINAIDSRRFNWKSSIKYDGFEGVSSYQEAKNILYTGNEKLELEVYNKLDIKGDKIVKVKSHNSVVGQRVCVPRFLDNNPKYMIKKTNTSKKAKFLKIVLDGGISCGYDAEEILNRGNILFNFFEYLKKENYIYKAYISYNFTHFDDDEEPGYECLVKVKESNEALTRLSKNLLLCLPSTFRALMFRWYETFPGSVEICGYGRPIGKQRDEVNIKDYYNKLLNVCGEKDDVFIICFSEISCLEDIINSLKSSN